LGKAGEGTKIAYETMKLARFGLGMLAVEVMNRALSEGIAYASERNISSGVLISNTYIRSKFAYFQTARDAFSEYLNEQFNFLDMFKEIPELSALLSKIHGAELAFECVDFVMQIMGGRGYSLSSRVPNLYQDLRLLRVFEGPTEALLDRLGSICLKEESYMISNKRILKFLAHNSLKEHSSFKYLIARAYIVDCLYSKSSAEFFDIEMAHLKLFAQQLMLSKDLTQESSHFLTDKDDLIKEFLGPKMPTAKALSSNLETPVRSAKRIYKVTESSNSIEPISKPKIETQAASDKSLEKFIETWLVSHKKITGVEAQNITDNTRFTELGIDSLAGMDLIYALEKEYGVTIPESALWDYPSPKQLSDFIEKSKKQKRPN
jgi:acyl carrier protein